MKYLVLDTNVLIHNLDVLRCFSEDLERLAAPMKIVVPDVVLSELDGCVWARSSSPQIVGGAKLAKLTDGRVGLRKAVSRGSRVLRRRCCCRK